MNAMAEYASIYWAAACLVFWAGGGANVTAGQMVDAIDMVCDEAGMSVAHEALLKRIVNDMLKGQHETNRRDS
jgi:hypothetical protein